MGGIEGVVWVAQLSVTLRLIAVEMLFSYERSLLQAGRVANGNLTVGINMDVVSLLLRLEEPFTRVVYGFLLGRWCWGRGI